LPGNVEESATEAELPVLAKALDDLAAEVPGPGHQDLLQVAARAPDAAEGGANREPGGGHEHGIDQSKHGQEQTGVRELAVEVEARGQQHGREQHRQRDPHRLVCPRQDPAPVVQALEVEHDGPQDRDHRNQPQVGLDRRQPLGHRLDLDLEAQPIGHQHGDHSGADVAGELDQRLDLASPLDHPRSLPSSSRSSR
jgi:hypothetical protein